MAMRRQEFARCSPKHVTRIPDSGLAHISPEAVVFVMEAGKIDASQQADINTHLQRVVRSYDDLPSPDDPEERLAPSQRKADWSLLCKAGRNIQKVLALPRIQRAMIARQGYWNALDPTYQCRDDYDVAKHEAARKQVEDEIDALTSALAPVLRRAEFEAKQKQWDHRGSKDDIRLSNVSLLIVNCWSVSLSRQEDDPLLFFFAKEIYGLLGRDSTEPKTIRERLRPHISGRARVKEKVQKSS